MKQLSAWILLLLFGACFFGLAHSAIEAVDAVEAVEAIDATDATEAIGKSH